MEYQSFLIKYAEIGTKGKNRYLFEDESGRVVVEIEHETFGHLTVTPQDKVRLVGHVDWSSKHPNEVEVDALAIIQ